MPFNERIGQILSQGHFSAAQQMAESMKNRLARKPDRVKLFACVFAGFVWMSAPQNLFTRKPNIGSRFPNAKQFG
jgi:hypothetical protein